VSHFKHQILIVTLAAMATPAFAGSERLIYDPDSAYFMSDIDQSQADPGQNFVLRGGIGYASIVAHEHVYAGASGNENLSLLLWESKAPIANVDLKARLPDAWTLRGHIDAAVAGDSTMTDYDWTSFSPSYDFNDWDHRSISPNTSLDWYLKGDIAIGRDLPINEEFTVNVNGGFGYTDVQWTAVGGTFIYSDSTNGFRGTIGTIPDTPAVRYRQQLPTIFAGVDTFLNDGPWSMEAGARAGLVVYGQSVDHHYLRDPPMYVTDNLSLGQVLKADVKLDYNITDHLGLYVAGSYEKMFAGHTLTDYRKIADNTLLEHSNTIGGGELDVWSITGGVKGYF
jgi:plasminogen activator